MSRRVGGTTVSTDTQGTGRHRQALPQRVNKPVRRRHWARLVAVIAAVGAAVAAVIIFAVPDAEQPNSAVRSTPRQHHNPFALSTAPGSYIGLYASGIPESYAGVTAFTAATGVKPSVVLYYSGWLEPFQTSFASTVADNGAVLLVQIDPNGVNIASIASGQYDGYLTAYAEALRAYRHPVILSFGHEMNGYWYSWGYMHTRPSAFIAAWRHIVTLFRAVGARNVTWMWTVNTIHSRANVPNPRRWWPGSSYVTWVGIDGYYFSSSSTFAPLFGPTIAAVRALTTDPILIAETGALPSAGQPAKIADLFAGIRLYGLVGFVWFDSRNAVNQNFGINSPAAIAAFARGAETYHRRPS
jgi:mannan endo-1,4-beta-mannosidase